MIYTRMTTFRNWLEQIAPGDDVESAILATLPEELQGGDHDNEQLLASKTTDFGSDTLHRIRNLGIITNLKDEDSGRYQDVMHSIENGITIRELITKITGTESQSVPQHAIPQDSSMNTPDITTHQP